MKRVFSNVLAAILGALVIGIVSGILTMLMWVLGCIPSEIVGQYWVMPAEQVFWHNIIWGAVFALIVVIVLICVGEVMEEAYGKVHYDWERRKEPLKAGGAILAVLPVLALGVLACVLLCIFQGQAIAVVKDVLTANLWDGDAVWLMVGIIGAIGGACVTLALYFFAMCIVYGVKACQHCGALGWGHYKVDYVKTNKYQGYRETTTTKEFKWQDSDHNSHSISYEKPAYVAEETTVKTTYYSGECKFCHRTNTKQKTQSQKRDI